MIKKGLFEDQLAQDMQKGFDKSLKKQAMMDLDKAVNYLYSAAEILEAEGLIGQSEKVINILYKLGSEDNQDAKKTVDRHTKGLTPQKMVANLLEHGTVFNMSKNDANDLNDLEIGDEGLEVKEKELEDLDFEDEI